MIWEVKQYSFIKINGVLFFTTCYLKMIATCSLYHNLPKSKPTIFLRSVVSMETLICWHIFRFHLSLVSIYFSSFLFHFNDWHSLLSGSLIFFLEIWCQLFPIHFFMLVRMAPKLKRHSQNYCQKKLLILIFPLGDSFL